VSGVGLLLGFKNEPMYIVIVSFLWAVQRTEITNTFVVGTFLSLMQTQCRKANGKKLLLCVYGMKLFLATPNLDDIKYKSTFCFELSSIVHIELMM
jgi:hypothetical protein